ncbi:MAG: serine/threonine protein kinase [Oscillospiraceae bacterium]|nr:serine/threonine protein kinase [Oscillospiraceae bacterium]
MIEIRNKKLCESCFAEVVEEGKCPCCGFSKEEFEPDPLVLPMGTRLEDKIIIGRVMGKGGFGITYLGYDLRMEKTIAVKEYYPNGIACRSQTRTEVLVANANAEDTFEKGTEKFYNEAEMVAQFNGNPNIVGVYDYFRANNTVYLIMEYLNGVTLKNYVKKHGRISDGQALFIMDKMAAALSITHSAGVLHRDISPDNIMVCLDGKIKLIDFGAARQIMTESSSNLTVVMKPGYTPIEQYTKKGKQGAWTDVHALGASIYYALTEKVIDDPYERMEEDTEFKSNLHGIDDALWNIIKKCTMINAADRYSSAIELRKALSAVSDHVKAEPLTADIEDVKVEPRQESREKTASSAVLKTSAEKPAASAEAESSEPEVPENAGYDPNDNVYERVDGKKKKSKRKKPLIIILCSAAAVLAIAALIILLPYITAGKKVITVKIDSDFPGAWEPSSRAITAEDLSSFSGDVKVTLNMKFLLDNPEWEPWADTEIYHHHLAIWEMNGGLPEIRAFNKSRDQYGETFYLTFYTRGTTMENTFQSFVFVIPHDVIVESIPRGIFFVGNNLYVMSATLEDYNESDYAIGKDAVILDMLVERYDSYKTEFSQFITKKRLLNIGGGGDVRITLSIESEYIFDDGNVYITPFDERGRFLPLECINHYTESCENFYIGYYKTAPDTVSFVISAKQIEALTDRGFNFGINNGHIIRAYLEPA